MLYLLTKKFPLRPATARAFQPQNRSECNLRYDPNDPQSADIDSMLSFWLFPWILTIMGILTCCLDFFFALMYWFMPGVNGYWTADNASGCLTVSLFRKFGRKA